MEIWKGWKQKGGKKPGGGNSAKRGADGGDPAREGAYAGAGGPLSLIHIYPACGIENETLALEGFPERKRPESFFVHGKIRREAD